MSDNKFAIQDRPIEGDISQGSREPVDQWTPEQFLAVVDELLAVEGVKAIRWDQYTPYFNDGEPCEFSVNDVSVRFKGDKKGGDYEDGFYDSWGLKYYKKRDDGSELPEGLLEAMGKWSSAHIESVARANFGDHAQVTATKDGFSVEYYEHD